jgi:Ca2+-transporting ATPase
MKKKKRPGKALPVDCPYKTSVPAPCPGHPVETGAGSAKDVLPQTLDQDSAGCSLPPHAPVVAASGQAELLPQHPDESAASKSCLFRDPGLTHAQVIEQRRLHGTNGMTPPERLPWYVLYLEKFDDPLIRILVVAAILATIAGSYQGNYLEGIAILITIFLATFIGFANEYKAGKEFDLLIQAQDQCPAKVIREGAVLTVPRVDIVVRDVVLFETGDEIPADGEVLVAVSLMVNEARLTGEAFPVPKMPPGVCAMIPAGPCVYPAFRLLRSSMVSEGYGVMKVTAVGDRTEAGAVAQKAREEDHEPSPLSRQLTALSSVISFVGSSIALVIFAVFMAMSVYSGTLPLSVAEWLVLIMLGISGGVALVPLWLPLAYAGLGFFGFQVSPVGIFPDEGLKKWLPWLGLGLGILVIVGGFLMVAGMIPLDPRFWMSGFAARQILEYFMLVTAIIVVTVPEGLPMSVTLALAYGMRRMMAEQILVRHLHASETVGATTVICSDKTGTLTLSEMRVAEWGGACDPASPEFYRFVEALAVNSTAHICRKKGPEPEIIGNPTEGALLIWLQTTGGQEYLPCRESFQSNQQWAFSGVRKMMATLGISTDTRIGNVLWVKGAPEIILGACTTAAGGGVLTESVRAGILHELEIRQRRGMRTLGFAYRSCPPAGDLDEVAREMTWLGWVALEDPVRAEVPGAIGVCRKAGIDVRMVTGDNPLTALEVARKSGLWTETETESQHLSGVQFAELPESEALVRIDSIKILSRARPLDKLRFVELLKQKGHVVAVTGDGTNDAPALKAAHVGLAMGKTGTDMAKEAGDIVLLNDSFAGIVTAILWGRSLYLNIQRFLVFQVTVNVMALGITLMGPFLGIRLPLTVIQMLWVNLIMDTFAALAFATEPPHRSLMNRPPRDQETFIVDASMRRAIFPLAFTVLAVLVIAFSLLHPGQPVSDYELTVFFTAFILIQFWNMFQVRGFGAVYSGFGSLGRNPWFAFIAGIILLLQFGIVTFGGAVFRTVPLEWHHWALLFIATFPVVLVGKLFAGRDQQPGISKESGHGLVS